MAALAKQGHAVTAIVPHEAETKFTVTLGEVCGDQAGKIALSGDFSPSWGHLVQLPAPFFTHSPQAVLQPVQRKPQALR